MLVHTTEKLNYYQRTFYCKNKLSVEIQILVLL